MRHRIIAISAGLIGLIVFVVACVWEATDPDSLPGPVVTIMIGGVVCCVIVSVSSWLAPAADRQIGAALYAARERDLHGVR
jgi:hypothetical protein